MDGREIPDDYLVAFVEAVWGVPWADCGDEIPGSRYVRDNCRCCDDPIRVSAGRARGYVFCHACGGTKRRLMQRARGRSMKAIWETDEDFAGYQANARREYEEVRC